VVQSIFPTKRVEKGGAGGALAGQNPRLHFDMDGLFSEGRIEVAIPDHFDRSRLNNVAASIEATLIGAGNLHATLTIGVKARRRYNKAQNDSWRRAAGQKGAVNVL